MLCHFLNGTRDHYCVEKKTNKLEGRDKIKSADEMTRKSIPHERARGQKRTPTSWYVALIFKGPIFFKKCCQRQNLQMSSVCIDLPGRKTWNEGTIAVNKSRKNRRW